MQRRYLVAYDIADDRRRDRIATCLKGYGDRVQYSVFAVDVRPARLVRLRGQLELLINGFEDYILLCDLGPVHLVDRRKFEFLGRAASLTGGGPLVL